MATRTSSGGLPIAAHLALMLALAFTAAFVVCVAVIIWLPPRPPEVVRGDQLIERFARGYADTARTGHAPGDENLVWSIVPTAPFHTRGSGGAHLVQIQLAQRLSLPPQNVRISAESARADTFVYQVRSIDHRMLVNGVEVVHEGDNVTIVRPREGETRQEFHFEYPPPERRTRESTAHEAGSHGVDTREAQRPTRPAPATPPIPPPPLFTTVSPNGFVLLSGFEIGAKLPDGRWLTMKQGRNWETIGWMGRAALAVGAMLLLATLLALFFARRLARPIQGFANAVQAVGVDPQSEPVAEKGPREMRRAARAVNDMQARLRALIADRTKTLATVAHDMRTPLMRLRLTAENADPVLREKMAKEIGEVEALVASFISFARDDPAEEARVRVDLSALLQSLVDDQAATGRNVSFDGAQRFIVTGQSLGLKRLFNNLIDNAVKYGGVARVRLTEDNGAAIVDVEDDGPGVPLAEREDVFKPFVRLTAAAGGAGLGLPAARSIARAHGGDIVILDSERGAKFRTTLPL